MKSVEDLGKLVKRLQFKASANLHERTINDALQAQAKSKMTKSAVAEPNIWRIIMKSKTTKLAAAAAVLIITLYMFVGNSGPAAWAIEQTIEAIKHYKGSYISGTILINGTETSFEMWARVNSNDSMTEELLVKLGDSSIIQVKDNATYYYARQTNTVYVDDAKTAGFSTMFGPQFYELVEKAPEFKTTYDRDAAGKRVVILTSSLVDVSGPASWIIELDVESKLPVSMKKWDNFNRTGKPNFYAQKMLYFDNLPDSAFEAEIPQDAKYIERPLTIPDENIALLSHPKYGIQAEYKSQEQASKEIVEKLYEAVIAGDIPAFKELCPLADTFSDEFLRYAFLSLGKDNPITELVEIGGICKRGNSKLGPLVAVPVVFRTKDGKLWDEKMIVQFRGTGENFSCVIYGPYGLPSEKK